MFETARTLVRHLQDSDFEEFYAICRDPELMRLMGDGQPLSEELTRKWIAVSQENYRTKGFGCSAVIDKSSGKMIGFAGLIKPRERPGSVEIIYAFLKETWGKGIATEVVRGILNDGFQVHHLPQIEATIHELNAASCRVVEKAGMQRFQSIREEDGFLTHYYEAQHKQAP